jgi:predicted dehydrogenase
MAPANPEPRMSRPIYIVGAGGIVNTAHLPAYALAGFPVEGIYDVDPSRSQALAERFHIARAHPTLDSLVAAAPAHAVFDVAVPARELGPILAALPDGAAVLIQKPFGETLEQARELLALCQRKRLVASVNFQLRYAPYVEAARALIGAGAIGNLHSVEVRVTVFMPWHLWTFLETAPRVEILYHSIHYVDLIRSFLGDPKAVYAKTLKHPNSPKLAATRTTICMDYGETTRALITTNHGHRFGPEHQESYVLWEGTRGAIKARLGLLLDYPQGRPDALQMSTLGADGQATPWRDVPFEGSWYPHAFKGTMGALIAFANGQADPLPTRVEDAFRTMAVVEACYQSSARGGTPIPSS